MANFLASFKVCNKVADYSKRVETPENDKIALNESTILKFTDFNFKNKCQSIYCHRKLPSTVRGFCCNDCEKDFSHNKHCKRQFDEININKTALCNFLKDIPEKDNSLKTEPSFIVFYTFDYNSESKKFINMSSLDMLLISIRTCIKECKGLAKIMVYTTSPAIFGEQINSYKNIASHVSIRLYDRDKYVDPNLALDKNKGDFAHFNNIGHSRVFLAEELINEFKRPLIYLDSDTFFTKNSYLKLSYMFKSYNKPISCCYENNGKGFPQYLSHKYSHLIQYNNGIIIYPYREENKDIINTFILETKKTYLDLKRDYNIFFDDMFAHTLTCYRMNAFDCLSFLEINYLPAIIHYCDIKWSINSLKKDSPGILGLISLMFQH